jgi:hypothetical protein
MGGIKWNILLALKLATTALSLNVSMAQASAFQAKAGIRKISGVRIFKVAKLKTATKRDYKTYEKF